MNKEIESVKKHQVFTQININDIPPEDRKNLIQSRWVHREKGTEVRSRIVAKGYNEVVNDLDDIYASAPIFCILRILLTLALTLRWTIRAGRARHAQQQTREHPRDGSTQDYRA